MINTEQIATHIMRYMKEDGLSKDEAQKRALENLNIQDELTEEQQKAVDNHIKEQQEALNEDQEQTQNEIEDNQEYNAELAQENPMMDATSADLERE